MILRAAHYAETDRYVSPFRHILSTSSRISRKAGPGW